MVLDSKLTKIRQAYNVQTFDDWARLSPGDILKLAGIGRVTLDHVRLYLAGHGVTLKDDLTPDFWLANPRKTKIVQQMTAGDDESVLCPFRVVIDSNEQEPFSFVGIRADSDQQNRPLVVPVVWRSLGRHPYQFGDYSVEGFIGRVQVERKSVSDCQSTLLDFRKGGGRDRFTRELQNLSNVEAPLVIVEGSIGQVLERKNEHRAREHRDVAKQLYRSILAMMQDYRVPWFFAESRRMAEITTFRFLERFWKKHAKQAKSTEAMLEQL